MRDAPPRPEPLLSLADRAREAAASGRFPDAAEAFLRIYGVPPRRLRKHRRETAFLRKALAPEGPFESLLDVPCGWGRLAPAFASRARRVVFADLDAGRLELARRLGLAPRGRSVRCDALALPFADQSFDAVLSLHLNYHLETSPQRLRHVEECFRAARRLVVLSFHERASPRRLLRALGRPFRARPPVRALSFAALRAAAFRFGFSVIATRRLSAYSGHRMAAFQRNPSM